MFDYIEFESVKHKILGMKNESFDCVYRATFVTGEVTNNDFLPYNIEKKKAALDYTEPGTYSVSLNLSIQGIENIKKGNKAFAKTHKGIAKGKTNVEKGISQLSDQKTGHVNYFLFDYINNSPLEDFEAMQSE